MWGGWHLWILFKYYPNWAPLLDALYKKTPHSPSTHQTQTFTFLGFFLLLELSFWKLPLTLKIVPFTFFLYEKACLCTIDNILSTICVFFAFFCEHIFLLQKLFFLAFSFSNKKKLYWKKVILRFLKSEICPSLAAIMFPLEIIWNERKNFWAPLVFAWLFHYLIFEWFFAFWTSLELSHYWDTEIHKKTFCLFNKFLAFS